MIPPENSSTIQHRDELKALIDAAIGGDVIADEGGGFVSIMGKGNPNIRQDVAAAFEMYALFEHYLRTLPLFEVSLGGTDALLAPSILYDVVGGRVLVLLSIGAQELELVAHWIAGGLRSDTVKAMPGLLALPFAIEKHDDVQHLIPEWFAAFYANANEDHCVPILALRSVTLDERFGDWVSIALERMQTFGLPCSTASGAIKQKTA